LAKLLIKEHRKVSQKGGGIAPRIVIVWNCATATAINLNVELSIKGPASCQPSAGSKENTFAYLHSADCTGNLFLLTKWVKRGCGG